MKKKVQQTLLGSILSGIAALSALLAVPAAAKDEIRVLLLGGGRHHDYARWYGQVDRQTLESKGLATVAYTEQPDDVAKQLADVDVLYVATNQPIESAAVRQAILDFADAGKGLVLGHPANWYNWKDWPEYNAQLVAGGTRGHDPYGRFAVRVIDSAHPVMKGIRGFETDDERYYYQPVATGPGVQVLANSGDARIQPVYPVVFVVNHPRARIVGITLGHDGGAHDLPQYRRLLRQAVEWSARRK